MVVRCCSEMWFGEGGDADKVSFYPQLDMRYKKNVGRVSGYHLGHIRSLNV